MGFIVTAPQSSGASPQGGSGGFTVTPPSNSGSTPSYVSPMASGLGATDQAEASQSGATFPANTTKDNMLTAAMKSVANIPSSIVNFGKGIASMFAKTPSTIVQDVQGFSQAASDYGGGAKGAAKAGVELAKNLPGAAYNVVVPPAARNMLTAITGFKFDVGGTPQITSDPNEKEQARQKALAAIVDDPVSQIAPFLLMAKQAADSAGVGDQFDTAVKTITDPVKSVAMAPLKGAGAVASQALGMTTGAGADSIKAAAGGSPEFTAAMRGNVSPEDIVGKAQDAFQKVVDQRRQQYLSDFKNLDQYKKSADISTLPTKISAQLDNFGVKVKDDGTLDFSRSAIANNSAARADIQGVYDTVKDWGTQSGDRTVQGLDTLKKQLGDFYSQSSQARAFVTSIKSSVSDILNKNYPDYAKMTKGYADASDMLSDIKSATSLGGKAGYDTIFTKLTRALKSDTGFKSEMVNELQDKSGVNLKDYIAGFNMSSLKPSGLGGAIDMGAALALVSRIVSPEELVPLLSTSPRIVGEFVRALGVGATGVAKVMSAINALQTPEGTAFISNSANVNQNTNQNQAQPQPTSTPAQAPGSTPSFMVTPPAQNQSSSFLSPMQQQ